MEFIINKKEPKDITVRDLINKLLDCDMDDIIIVKDSSGVELHNITLYTRELEKPLGHLFG